MNKNNQKEKVVRKGIICLIIGILVLAFACGYGAYNYDIAETLTSIQKGAFTFLEVVMFLSGFTSIGVAISYFISY